MKRVIQLFLKAPRPGTVKTRLARDVGDAEAVRIYRWLVERQLQHLPDWPLQIHFAPADAEEEMKDWLGGGLTYHPQCDGDLGDRLAHGVKTAFDQGTNRVFCLGADCPDLDAAYVEKADRCLDDGAEAVFGPAEDGGYVLLALNRYAPCLFRDIPWSTGQTLARSLEQAASAALRVRTLPALRDMDTLDDWRSVRHRIPPDVI